MSSGRGSQQSRGRGDRGRGSRGGPGGAGGRGGGRGQPMDLPIRQGSPGDGRGRGRGRGDAGDRGRGGFRGGRGGFDQGPKVFSQGAVVPTPDENVQKVENEIVTALSKKERKPGEPERPGYGTRGNPITLFANYFNLKSVGKELYRYHAEILSSSSKKAPAGKKAQNIITLLLDQHFADKRRSIVTDYKSTIIANTKLLGGIEDNFAPFDYDVRYKDEHDSEYPDEPQVYRVRCQFTNKLNPSDLLNYLTSADAGAMFNSKDQVIQAMNIVLGYHPKTDPTVGSVGANKHFALQKSARESFDLGAGLKAFRGFFISARAATSRLLVNVQVKYVACYHEGPLADVISEFRRGRSRDPNELRRFLEKLRIRVTHIERKNKRGEVVPRFKTIAGLATMADGASLAHRPKVSRNGGGPKDVQFYLDAPGQQSSSQGSSKGKKPAKAGPAPPGKYVSVAEFFRDQYKLNTEPGMPVVNVGTRENPSYLPVEACVVEPGQPAKTKLTPTQTSNMLRFAVRAPPQNAQSIVKGGKDVLGLGAPPNATLVDFNVHPDPSLITVHGRVLPAPNVYYKNAKNSQTQIRPKFGSWNMIDIKFSKPSSMTNWTWLLIDVEGRQPSFGNPKALDDVLKGFSSKLSEIGVMTNHPKAGNRIVVDPDNHNEEIDQAIADLLRQHKPQVILTVLPYNSTSMYNCVKLSCDIKHGVRNVNVLADKFKSERGQEQYFANVGLKFNLKLGGINQFLPASELGIIGQGKTMLVGIDVTHPSPGSSPDAPSIAGMVASMDASLGQWPAEIHIQREKRNEMVESLDVMLKAHLNRWVRIHKTYPENIIVYRDGVSEGQYDLVTENERKLLKKACADVYPAPDTKKALPRLSIIIVGKRHHTRFYPSSEANIDRSCNSPNGTVVDRGVTEARNWDFYLQAHTALKGTARPAHYFTVWDEIFLHQKPSGPNKNAADMLENLTHHLCYLFGRATKAVSVCPPAYYADLVCTRARCYLSNLFEGSTGGSVTTGSGGGLLADDQDVRIHENVKNTMFYI